MTSYKFDVLVIGTGIAGLTTAVKLAENNLNVCIITRANDPANTNTYHAQGGIIFPTLSDDKLESDILKASAGTANLVAAKVLTDRSEDILKEILIDKAETPFSKDKQGNLKLTKEAAHSIARILYKGDYTGKAIETSLLSFLNNKKRFPNVSFLTEHTAIDLLTPGHHGVRIQQRYEENKVVGAYVLNQKTGDVIKVVAKKTVLATGGIGALYLHHSNSEGSRGDGHAMARRAGAILTNMEFIQFHPTTYYDKSSHRRFLISEAVRGEGGILRNSAGSAFMDEYHVDRELAPRDVVARAIMTETIKTQHECVYLDISDKNAEWIKDRFPTIYSNCLEHNIDITKEPIPVVPAAHYTCGGVQTDLKGRATLKNLYAVGEVACTGLHGANRLASTALLEGLTFGYIAAEDIIDEIDKSELYKSTDIKNWDFVGTTEVEIALIQQDWLTLKQTMWNYAGLTRTTDRLVRARAMFSELYEEVQRFYRNASIHDELIGLRNAVEVGHTVIGASMRNKDSVGCFYRKY